MTPEQIRTNAENHGRSEVVSFPVELISYMAGYGSQMQLDSIQGHATLTPLNKRVAGLSLNVSGISHSEPKEKKQLNINIQLTPENARKIAAYLNDLADISERLGPSPKADRNVSQRPELLVLEQPNDRDVI